jgi:hypothetical protein
MNNKKIFFTISGTFFHHGEEFLEKDMEISLIKEPDNKYDAEAIKVEIEGLDTIGYVANSPTTVKGKSYSAGRLYDKIGDTAKGTILYKLDDGILCLLDLNSLI